MNKKIKTLLAASVLTVAMGTTALADNTAVTELKQAMISMGVPSNYIGNVVEYLQRVNITNAQKNQAMGYIQQAKNLIGDTKDISKLPASVKSNIQSLAVQAGNVLGMNVNFGKNSNGKTTVVVTTSNGGTLLQLSTTDVIGSVENFDINKIINFIEEAVEFSNDPNKNNTGGNSGSTGGNSGSGYVPEGGGTLNGTATPYGNIMMAGTTMMTMAGGIHVLSKKRK